MGDQLPPVRPDEAGNVVSLATDYTQEAQARAAHLQSRLLTFRGLNEEPDVPQELMLGELLVRGHRLLIGADSGHGKSTFVNDMIRCMATGDSFLESNHFLGIKPGWVDGGHDPYRVLVIDCEQSPRTVKRRLRDAGIQDLEFCHYWLIPEGLDISSRHKIDYQVLQSNLETLRPDVVVIDPLFKLHRGDPNSSELAAQVMSAVDGWRSQFNFGLVIPVHVRKIPTAQGATRKISLSDVYGAGTWTWGSEVVVGLERHIDQTGRQSTTMRWLKCRDDGSKFEESWGMVLTAGGVFRRLLQKENPNPTGKKQDQKARARGLLMNLLRESGRRFTTNELWEETREATGLDLPELSGIVHQWWSVSPLNPKVTANRPDAFELDRRKVGGRLEYWWGPGIRGDALPGVRDAQPGRGAKVVEDDPFGLEADMVDDIISGGVPEDSDEED